MGLDISLYKKLDDFEKYAKLQEEYELKEEENWNISGKKYDELTEIERTEISEKNKRLALEMGLNKWGDIPTGHKEEKIEFPSKKYPNHLFKIGYFRSSYNDGGFNHITRNFIGKDLYTIFEPEDNEYHVKVNWKLARQKCIAFLDEFKKKVREFPYQCTRVSHHREPINEEKALEIFKEELDKNLKQNDKWDYYNHKGLFIMNNPLKIHAVIQGMGLFGPETYLIHEGKYEHYMQSAEIVLETINYVLNQPDPEKYFFHWSG